jgi:hypothetical protein
VRAISNEYLNTFLAVFQTFVKVYPYSFCTLPSVLVSFEFASMQPYRPSVALTTEQLAAM